MNSAPPPSPITAGVQFRWPAHPAEWTREDSVWNGARAYARAPDRDAQTKERADIDLYERADILTVQRRGWASYGCRAKRCNNCNCKGVPILPTNSQVEDAPSDNPIWREAKPSNAGRAMLSYPILSYPIVSCGYAIIYYPLPGAHILQSTLAQAATNPTYRLRGEKPRPLPPKKKKREKSFRDL